MLHDFMLFFNFSCNKQSGSLFAALFSVCTQLKKSIPASTRLSRAEAEAPFKSIPASTRLSRAGSRGAFQMYMKVFSLGSNN